MKKYEITEEQANAVLAYLSRQSYVDVFKLIEMLTRGLIEIVETPAKTHKTIVQEKIEENGIPETPNNKPQ